MRRRGRRATSLFGPERRRRASNCFRAGPSSRARRRPPTTRAPGRRVCERQSGPPPHPGRRISSRGAASMIRVGTLFWLVLVSASSFAMFGVKYQVQALEDELARTKRATAAEEHEIRVLDAEWAYLTRP